MHNYYHDCCFLMIHVHSVTSDVYGNMQDYCKNLYLDSTDVLNTFTTTRGQNGQDGDVQTSGTILLSLSNSFVLSLVTCIIIQL